MTKPKVILFNSISLDGCMDGGGDDMGLYYHLAARWKAEAMLSGSETMIAAFSGQAETPPSSAPKELHPLAVPLLVVVDSRARIHCWNLINQQVFWKDVVVLVSRTTPPDYLAELEQKGISHIMTGEEKVDFAAALEELNTRFGIHTVRVDSGGVLNGVLLRAGLVDEVSVLVTPTLAGSTSPKPLFVAHNANDPGPAIPLKLIHFEQVQEGILWLKYEIIRPS